MIDKLTRSKCIVLTYPTEDGLEATDIDLFIEGTTSIYEYTDCRLGTWFITEIHNKIKAFKSASKSQQSSLLCFIKDLQETKIASLRKIETQYPCCNNHRICQGIQAVTNYRAKNTTIRETDRTLKLNSFYTHFSATSYDIPSNLPSKPSEVNPQKSSRRKQDLMLFYQGY